MSYNSLQMERISNIIYGCPGKALEIRVLRRWVPFLKDSEIWFLIVDRHGDAIQVLAQKIDQRFVDANLIVSYCYKIEDYTCSESNDFQRMLQNPLHLNIGPASSITGIEETDTLPKFWFRFCKSIDLQNIDHKIQGYPDVIGVFTRVKDCNKKNRDREPYLLLSLTDADAEELTITLWKECIEMPEKLNRPLLSACKSDSILAVTNVKAYIYEGKLRINSTSATLVYIDPNVPEKDVLLHRLHSTEDPLSFVHARHPSIQLQDLANRDHADVMGKTFLCKAQIKDYKMTHSWYTVFCITCGNEIVEQGDRWFCTTDGKTESPRFSYNISALLDDGSTFVQATMTDNTVAKIIGIQCHELVVTEKQRDRKKLPPQFQHPKKNHYNFHIQLGKWSTPQRRTYIVVDISGNAICAYDMTPDTLPLTGPTPSTDPEDQSILARTSSSSAVDDRIKRQLLFSSPDHLSPSKKEKITD